MALVESHVALATPICILRLLLAGAAVKPLPVRGQGRRPQAVWYDGTPFTDVGFQKIPALSHLQGWLEEVRNAA